MGKSPGKWIKTALFGKKSSKSKFSNNSTVEKNISTVAKAESGDLAVDYPAIADVPPQATENGADPEVTAGLMSANNAEIRLEQAAIKAQTIFRGFLARRAYRALKGIIRLQALVRGHLVRRQAVSTLRCMRTIVKFQKLARGRRIRLSDGGHEVVKNCDASVVDLFGKQPKKLSTNAFVRKLIASFPTALSLSLQYDLVEPNSAWNWLERWSSSCFWEPLPDLNSQIKQPRRPKRGVRKASAINGGNNSSHSAAENEKPKRTLKKAPSHQAELVQEHPQSELEKVKTSLRKISVPTEEPSKKSKAVAEKLQCSSKEVSSTPDPDLSELRIDNSSEKLSDPVGALSTEPMVEIPPNVEPMVETPPKVEKSPIINELSSKEYQTSNESERTRKRRSFPAKEEYPENVTQNTPTLPSYMAATQSAKAKLKAQGSPRFGQDGDENGVIRRLSLPSSTNGNVSSLSPRMPRTVQANGKVGSRSGRSLLSSKDEKPLQAGWRR